jgi:transcriptional regulator with XRE-family HTH domain
MTRIAVKAHPLVRRLCAEADLQGVSHPELARRAGVSPETIKDWRRRSTPNVETLEACFNVLGFSLQPQRLGGVP